MQRILRMNLYHGKIGDVNREGKRRDFEIWQAREPHTQLFLISYDSIFRSSVERSIPRIPAARLLFHCMC